MQVIPQSRALQESEVAQLEELWVRYCQTGKKWGSSYPPSEKLSQLYLSSRFDTLSPSPQSGSIKGLHLPPAGEKRDPSPSPDLMPTTKGRGNFSTTTTFRTTGSDTPPPRKIRKYDYMRVKPAVG